MDEETKSKIDQLEGKYATMGQDLSSYLDGLLMSNPLNYLDYIRMDSLMSLQTPRTDFPDESIFIMYHQITELYFKLCLHEMEQISYNGRDIQGNGEDMGWKEALDPDFMVARVQRINRYFESLIKSFEIMVVGMER